MGIPPERHASYRQLIAQTIVEMRRVLSQASEPAEPHIRLQRMESAIHAATALADAVLPLAQSSANHFIDLEQAEFWKQFDAALEICGEFDRYPARIRQRRRP